MTPPLIGIIPSRRTDADGATSVNLPETYIQAIVSAGGAPVVIPLGLDEDTLRSIASRLDGLLFSGGGDVHPERYGSVMHTAVHSIDTDRDRVELFLLQETIKQQTPFLGICRGLQVINVGLGGTLYEDILDQHPNAIDHRSQPGKPRHYLAHPVEVVLESQLGRILGAQKVEVNSLHHQGIRRLAPGLRSTATAPDGIIEAFELPDYPFGLAVQWHPECLPDHPAMRRIFQAFIQAAAAHPEREKSS